LPDLAGRDQDEREVRSRTRFLHHPLVHRIAHERFRLPLPGNFDRAGRYDGWHEWRCHLFDVRHHDAIVGQVSDYGDAGSVVLQRDVYGHDGRAGPAHVPNLPDQHVPGEELLRSDRDELGAVLAARVDRVLGVARRNDTTRLFDVPEVQSRRVGAERPRRSAFDLQAWARTAGVRAVLDESLEQTPRVEIRRAGQHRLTPGDHARGQGIPYLPVRDHFVLVHEERALVHHDAGQVAAAAGQAALLGRNHFDGH